MSNCKSFFRSFFSFFVKVAIVHTFTYIAFGILASNLADYSTLYSINTVSSFMRNFDSPWIVIGPFLQPLRALFIAIALYPLIDMLKTSKFGWLKLWSLFVCLAIIAPPSAAPGSFEGLIYTQLPISFHLKGLPEILIQTLAFSFLLWVWIALPFKQKEMSSKIFLFNLARSIIVAFCGSILFSISGIILYNFLGIDMASAKLDRSSVAILTLIGLLSTIASYVLAPRASKNPIWHVVLAPVYIIIYTLVPYLYNYILDLPINTTAALIPLSLVSIAVIVLSFFIFGRVKDKVTIDENIKNIEYDPSGRKDTEVK